jgi:hypothetical protein
MSVGASMSSDFGDLRLEAARKRLQEVGSRDEVLEAMREVVTNLLGCEEIGLFSFQNDDSKLVWSFGIDTQDYKSLDKFDESGLAQVRRGEIQIDKSATQATDGGTLRVFVPIYAAGQVVAVLVLFELLPQKVDFGESDLKIAMVLCNEVGRKLFAGAAYGGIQLSGDMNG